LRVCRQQLLQLRKVAGGVQRLRQSRCVLSESGADESSESEFEQHVDLSVYVFGLLGKKSKMLGDVGAGQSIRSQRDTKFK